MTETWYTWATNPTGTVHTVARVRGNALPDGTSVPNDAVTPLHRRARRRSSRSSTAPRPGAVTSSRAARFYTELGSSAASLADADVKKHLLGAIQWASGMVRGGCKAGINSNYTATRITPQNPSRRRTRLLRRDDQVGARRRRPRLLRRPRDLLPRPRPRSATGTRPNTGLGCGTIHVWDPRVEGSNNQNPAKIAKVAELSVFGAKGNAPSTARTPRPRPAWSAMTLDPDFTKGRPYMYIQYYPYWGGEQGKDTTPKLGMGFDRRTLQGREAPLALHLRRRDQDVRARLGEGHLLLHLAGLQLLPQRRRHGLGLQGQPLHHQRRQRAERHHGNGANNQSNNNTGGYTNPDPHFTIPCPGAGADDALRRDARRPSARPTPGR